MAEQFDGYYKWLGIPPKDQPPNHYRLLGLELFEDNADVIETAAERQATYLHEVSSGPHVKESQKLLNEVAAARLCLLDPEKRAAYDAKLKSRLTANVTVDALPGEDSRLNDLPWDDLEPLMQNGSTSDTEPKAQAASETLPLPSDSSGVFSAPKSLADSGTMPAVKKDTKSPKPKTIWLAVGGAVVVVIAVAAVAIILATREDTSEVAEEQPQQEQRQIQANPATNVNGDKDKTDGGKSDSGETNGGETNGGETNGGETNGGETNGGETNGGETNGGETNGGETNGGETNGGKTSGPNTNGNGTKEPNGGKPVTNKKPINTDGFEPLEPLRLISGLGATDFSILDDKSVLAKGGDEEDVYTITLETHFPNLTAIRLEALPHDDFDANGPGHGTSGSFSIFEIDVAAAPSYDPTDSPGVPVSGVESKDHPTAIDKLIDGNSLTFWRVRRPGKSTTLTIFMQDPIWYDRGSTILYLRLRQREKLGRFRISVSNDDGLAGTKTWIKADLPLLVNVGGGKLTDRNGTTWLASEPTSGEFGYVGGRQVGNGAGSPLTSCVSGIEHFWVNLPDDKKYNVKLLFNGRWPKDIGSRAFSVNAPGVKTQPVKDIPKYQNRVTGAVTLGLPKVLAQDGVLKVSFKPEKGETILHAVEVYEAQ